MKLSLAAIVLVSFAVATGCSENKKSTTAPMSGSALNVNPVAAPAAQYTPPAAPQPVLAAAPADNSQPVIGDAVADASDSISPSAAPARTAAPQHQVTHKTSASSGNSAKGARYTIKKGDSLWSIAQSHYGDGNKWKKIASANPKLNPDKVIVGQTITLP